MKKLIVSRHPGTIAWVRATLPDWSSVEAVASAAPDDVRGAHVIGNLPMHLAALTHTYDAVEFDGPAPRGEEYDPAAMADAGACLRRYMVRPVAVLHRASE